MFIFIFVRISVFIYNQGRQILIGYSDKIYNNSIILQAAWSLRRGALPAWMTAENNLMSGVRVAIEWSFGKAHRTFARLRYAPAHQLQASPVAQQYIVSMLLCNMHTCLNHGQHSLYFDCPPPSLHDYMSQ
jgi:hypothetical protein